MIRDAAMLKYAMIPPGTAAPGVGAYVRTWGRLCTISSPSALASRDAMSACRLDSVRIVPVILSGGAGTRLWPLSRETAPKPSMPLPDGETLLAKTAARALALPGVDRARHGHQPRVLLPHQGRLRRPARRRCPSARRSCSSRSAATRRRPSRSPRCGRSGGTATMRCCSCCRPIT